jgi:CheY-like chemotaxis protein
MHQGRVEASSALGQGSEFVVRLPVVLTPAPQPPSTRSETIEPTGPSLRVLVVDDNVDSTRSLALLLELSGHQVRTAHDGPTALEAARGFRPTVALLDIGLPGMNGYELAKKMREKPVHKNVMLVAVTGYGQNADRQRSKEAGFDYHLVKPVNFGELEQLLATVLKTTCSASATTSLTWSGPPSSSAVSTPPSTISSANGLPMKSASC